MKDYVICHGLLETPNHSFLYCGFVVKVWYTILCWLDFIIVIPLNMFILFECFIGPSPTKKIRNGLLLIWYIYDNLGVVENLE